MSCLFHYFFDNLFLAIMFLDLISFCTFFLFFVSVESGSCVYFSFLSYLMAYFNILVVNENIFLRFFIFLAFSQFRVMLLAVDCNGKLFIEKKIPSKYFRRHKWINSHYNQKEMDYSDYFYIDLKFALDF